MAVSWIALHVTDRCQLDCDHCLRDPGLKPVDIDLELVARILDEAKRLYRASEVALTGGEPSLHPRFGALIDTIVDRGYRWHMVTNGERFERVLSGLSERPERLAALSAIDFSLDGAEERTHDAIRGSGSFRTVMTAVTLANVSGLPFVLQMAVNRRNISEIEELALLAAELGAKSAVFELTQPTGTPLDGALRIEAAEATRARDRIERMNAVLAIPVTYSDGFPAHDPFHLCDSFRSEVLYVNADGTLDLCCRHAGVPSDGERSTVVADLKVESLATAHRAMMKLVSEAIDERIAALAVGQREAWDASPCNFCLSRFGKPHWTDASVGGPHALRPRWRNDRAAKASASGADTIRAATAARIEAPPRVERVRRSKAARGE